jgi:PAS domain S-box-containing protein
MTSPNEPDIASMSAENLYHRLKVLRQVIDHLSLATSFDDICRLTVELGRDLLGFDRLALFFLTDVPGVVVGTYGTDAQGNLRDEHHWRIPYHDKEIIELLRKHDRRLVVRKEHRLVDEHDMFVGIGWHVTALLWNGDDGIGWLVVDNLLSQRPLTEDDQEIISLYATTIGHLAHIKRTEEALRQREETARQFQEKLKSLHDVTTELAKAETFDALCEQAVVLGKHRLGFDRLGLWFIDERDPAMLIGTFGINENGDVRDERQERVPNNFDNEMMPILNNNVLLSTRTDVPLFNQRHEVVGYGSNAAARVRDGSRMMGWLSTDNFFRQQPFTEYELELLALYASSIGHLASRQKAIEMQIEERRLLRTILDAVPDEIFLRDRDGRYLLMNRQAWAVMPGVNSDQEVIGKTVFDVMPPDLAQRYYNDDQIVLSLGTSLLNIEEPGRTQSGAARSLLTTKVPLTDSQGEIIGLLGVARDITELKAAQQQALDAALYQTRVRLLYEVISNISHDFKSPLSIIHTSLYLMQRKPEADHSARLHLIKAQADLLERYIQQLLMISRLETTGVETWQPLNLNDLPVILSVAFDPQAKARGIALTWHISDTPLPILGSAHQLHQALGYLVQNALDFNMPQGTASVSTYASEHYAVITIEDGGTGIATDDLPHIFEPFYRADKARSRSGTGLGLAITKKIIELHGGTLTVESQLDVGSVFQVMLPLWLPSDSSA